MKKSCLLALCASAVMLSTSASAALVERLGGLAYYDTEADLTWLADANYAQTSGNDADGFLTWDQATDWAANLVIEGVTGWRLPDTIDVGNDGATFTSSYQGVDYGYNITAPSELSNMFYNVLGNTAYYDTNGDTTGCDAQSYCLTNTGPFSNIQLGGYWSGTEYAIDTAQAWYFNMHEGSQYKSFKVFYFYAWAVRSGDVSAVPVPAAMWLFGSGLLGLISFARRKRAH